MCKIWFDEKNFAWKVNWFHEIFSTFCYFLIHWFHENSSKTRIQSHKILLKNCFNKLFFTCNQWHSILVIWDNILPLNSFLGLWFSNTQLCPKQLNYWYIQPMLSWSDRSRNKCWQMTHISIWKKKKKNEISPVNLEIFHFIIK